MPLPDTTQDQWKALSSSENITYTRWNALIADLLTLLQGGLDRANVTDGGLLPGDMDGNAMTLANGSISGNTGEQTCSRETSFADKLTVADELVKDQVNALTSTITATPSADNVNTYFVRLDSGTVALTNLTGGEEGQEVVIYGMKSSGDTGVFSMVHQATAATVGFNLEGGVDFAPAPAANDEDMFAICVRYTTANGLYTNGKWVEMWRRVV